MPFFLCAIKMKGRRGRHLPVTTACSESVERVHRDGKETADAFAKKKRKKMESSGWLGTESELQYFCPTAVGAIIP